jgi:hypothetical protein
MTGYAVYREEYSRASHLSSPIRRYKDLHVSSTRARFVASRTSITKRPDRKAVNGIATSVCERPPTRCASPTRAAPRVAQSLPEISVSFAAFDTAGATTSTRVRPASAGKSRTRIAEFAAADVVGLLLGVAARASPTHANAEASATSPQRYPIDRGDEIQYRHDAISDKRIRTRCLPYMKAA